ncbi:protein unc-45 homolog B-like [Temnothorax nylanderi]|uniref:protein unc-45 homolog B-like n=1 Tax=Temnothorax nylanderi TaxID=102681 RepID=UPI003A8B67BA
MLAGLNYSLKGLGIVNKHRASIGMLTQAIRENKEEAIQQEWKEKGNEEFNKGDWSKALNYYTNALKLGIENNAEKGVCYKNRAVAYLMLGNYEEVIKDCNSALKICCNKTLYRRCQALEGLKRFDEAYQDAEIIVSSDPNNEIIQPVKERIHEIVQGRREDPNLSATISQMLDLAFNVSSDKENRTKPL